MRALHPGWEKHEDGEGAYYWHVKSGTIQRNPPSASESGPSHDDEEKKERSAVVRDVRSSRIFEEDFDPLLVAAAAVAASTTSPTNNGSMRAPASMSKSCTSGSIAELGKQIASTSGPLMGSDKREVGSGGDWKRRSMPPAGKDGAAPTDNDNKAIQVGKEKRN